MGAQKVMLPLDGKPMIDWVVQSLGALCQEVVLLAGGEGVPAQVGLRRVKDSPTGIGPMGGLRAVIQSVDADWVYLVSADVPFLRPEVGQLLASNAKRTQAVMPQVDGRLQPTCALYHKACLAAIDNLVAQQIYALHAIANMVPTTTVDELELRLVDPGLESFFNVNTPEDYAAAQRIAEYNSRP